MATIDNILNNLGLEKPANINNTNYYNNTNNTNNILTTSKIASLQEASNQKGSMTASPLESLREEDSSLSFVKKKVTRKLPAPWKGVKLDLFCNGERKDGSPSYKLNICVYDKLSGKQQHLMAALNSDFDSGVRRGVESQDWRAQGHWITVKQTRKNLNMIYEDVRSSKVGLKYNGGGTEHVVFVYQDRTGVWCVDYVRDGVIYQFDLCDDLNQKQQQANIIASGYHGSKMKRLLTSKDLGI